jgi:hypothetical protein
MNRSWIALSSSCDPGMVFRRISGDGHPVCKAASLADGLALV